MAVTGTHELATGMARGGFVKRRGGKRGGFKARGGKGGKSKPPKQQQSPQDQQDDTQQPEPRAKTGYGAGLPPPRPSPAPASDTGSMQINPGDSFTVTGEPAGPGLPPLAKPTGDMEAPDMSADQEEPATGYAEGGLVEDDYNYGGYDIPSSSYQEPVRSRRREDEDTGVVGGFRTNEAQEDTSLPENARLTQGTLEDTGVTGGFRTNELETLPAQQAQDRNPVQRGLDWLRDMFGLGEKPAPQTSLPTGYGDAQSAAETAQRNVAQAPTGLSALPAPETMRGYETYRPPTELPAWQAQPTSGRGVVPGAAPEQPQQLGYGFSGAAAEPQQVQAPQGSGGLQAYLSAQGAADPNRLAATLDQIQGANPHLDENGVNYKAVIDASQQGDQAVGELLQSFRGRYDGAIGGARGALAHNDVVASAELATRAHNQVPDNRSVTYTANPDGSVTATTRPSDGAGETQRFTLTAQQWDNYLEGVGTSFDHVIENGVERNLQIASGQVQAPTTTGAGGGVTGYGTPDVTADVANVTTQAGTAGPAMVRNPQAPSADPIPASSIPTGYQAGQQAATQAAQGQPTTTGQATQQRQDPNDINVQRSLGLYGGSRADAQFAARILENRQAIADNNARLQTNEPVRKVEWPFQHEPYGGLTTMRMYDQNGKLVDVELSAGINNITSLAGAYGPNGERFYTDQAWQGGKGLNTPTATAQGADEAIRSGNANYPQRQPGTPTIPHPASQQQGPQSPYDRYSELVVKAGPNFDRLNPQEQAELDALRKMESQPGYRSPGTQGIPGAQYNAQGMRLSDERQTSPRVQAALDEVRNAQGGRYFLSPGQGTSAAAYPINSPMRSSMNQARADVAADRRLSAQENARPTANYPLNPTSQQPGWTAPTRKFPLSVPSAGTQVNTPEYERGPPGSRGLGDPNSTTALLAPARAYQNQDGSPNMNFRTTGATAPPVNAPPGTHWVPGESGQNWRLSDSSKPEGFKDVKMYTASGVPINVRMPEGFDPSKLQYLNRTGRGEESIRVFPNPPTGADPNAAPAYSTPWSSLHPVPQQGLAGQAQEQGMENQRRAGANAGAMNPNYPGVTNVEGPAADDMSPAAVAQRTFPAGSQLKERQAYQEKLELQEREGRAKVETARTGAEGKADAAKLAAESRERIAKIRADASDRRTQVMADNNFWTNNVRQLDAAQQQIMIGIREKDKAAQAMGEKYELTPQEQAVWDRAVHSALTAPSRQAPGGAATTPNAPVTAPTSTPTGGPQQGVQIELSNGTRVPYTPGTRPPGATHFVYPNGQRVPIKQ